MLTLKCMAVTKST